MVSLGYPSLIETFATGANQPGTYAAAVVPAAGVPASCLSRTRLFGQYLLEAYPSDRLNVEVVFAC